MKGSFLRPALVALLILQFYNFMNSCLATTKIPSKTNIDYIKISCSATTDPKLCYNSLSSHSSKIQTNPELLAHTALNVTLTAAQSTSKMLEEMSKIHGLRPKEAAAVLDCIADISDSVDELQKSMRAMDHTRPDSDFGLKMNDIQTWVSAALEDEDTCMDGFGGKAMNGKVKSMVRKRIEEVAHLTSNALALINTYA